MSDRCPNPGVHGTVDPAAHPHEGGVDTTARVLGTILRWGVLIAAAVILLGVLLFIRRRGLHVVLLAPRGIPPGAQEDPNTVPQLLHDLTGNSRVPAAVTDVGLLALMITPVLSVIVSLLSFARERDWTYVILASIVLAMLAIGTLVGTL